MKSKFTKLMAALALLVFMMPTMVGWGQTVTQTNFTATSGNVNNDTHVSYAAYKGGGTSDPAVNSNAIRLYQNSSGATGGYVVIGVSNGYEITSATIQSTMATTTGYKLTSTDPGSTTPAKNTFNVSNHSLSANTDYTVNDISTQYIVFACFGTTSSSRLYLSKISITYQSTGGDPTTTYTVTYHANGGSGDDIENEYNEGSNVTIAANTFTYTGHAFTMWNTNASGTGTSYDPEDVIENISEDIDLYAQWEESNETVDVLNYAFTGISGVSYAAWSGKTGASGAVYAGRSGGDHNSIQLNSTSPNGIVSTTSGGKFTKVVVTWNSNTANNRSVQIYGKNTAYEGSADLYDNDKKGTLLGTLVKGTSTELNISDDYNYIGVKNPGSAIYIDEIKITWETSSSTDPSITGTAPAELTYDATSGQIGYTITNGVTGGAVSASVPSGSWITVPTGTITDNPFTFTCSPNPNAAQRSETVTLTYTYNAKATKTAQVTVTQAGNPNIVDNIEDITGAGTYTVKGKIFAKSNNAFIIGDGTGYVYVYKSTDKAIGSYVKVAGTVTTQYNNIYEFTSSGISITDADSFTITEASPTVMNGSAITSFVNYTGNILSSYVQYEGQLSISGSGNSTYYNLTIDGTSVQGSISKPTQDLSSYDGKTIKVTGYYVGKSTSSNITYFNTVLESFEEIVPTTPTITLDPTSITLGTVEVGQQVSRTFTVTQSNLTAGITLSVGAQGHGLLSITGVTPAASITIPQGDGETTVTWTYTPATNGEDLATTITASSTGATEKTLTISGTAATFYDVTFNAGEGTFVGSANLPNESNHVPAGSYTLPSATAPTGKVFDKWNIGDATYDAGASYTVSGDASFVASYTDYVAPLNVTYDFTTTSGTNVATYFYEDDQKTTHAAVGTNYSTLYYENGDVFTTTPSTTTTDNRKFNSGYFFLGKTNAMLNLPTYSGYNITQIIIHNTTSSSNPSLSVQVAIYSGDNEASAAQTLSSSDTDYTYDIAPAYQGSALSVKVVSNHNAQITGITVVRQAISNDPTVSVTPSSIPAIANGKTENLNITISNISSVDSDNISLDYCNADGSEITGSKPTFVEWDLDDIASNGTGYTLPITITPNNGEARTAYLHVIYDNSGTNVESNVITVTQEANVAPVPTITVDPASVSNVPAAGDVPEHTITLADMTVNDASAFDIYYCDSEGELIINQEDKPNWIEDVEFTAATGGGYDLAYVVTENTTTASRTAYFKVGAEPASSKALVYSNLITVTQAGVATTTTYTLATSIIPGKRYIIVSNDENHNTYFAMGEQRSNNRKAVEISVNESIATVSSNEVYEFVISEVENEDGYYSIYDDNTNSTGYLYAAASGSNHLKTESSLSDNSKWSISIDGTGIATILADKSSNRNLMRYNYNNNNPTIFSCYANGDNPTGIAPMLFVKNETYTMNIIGYNVSNPDKDGYYLIASPVSVNPENTGMITDHETDQANFTYDLYYFDQNPDSEEEDPTFEWRNYRKKHFDLTPGKGYLYANKNNVSLTFTGVPYSGNGEVTLTAGWNLIGNPLASQAYIGQAYYRLNEYGNALKDETESGAINMMEGVFVYSENGGSVTFGTNPNPVNPNVINIEVLQAVTNTRGTSNQLVDRAIVRFDNGSTLPKFMLNADNTKLYIPQNGKDMAIVDANNQGEMPVNFKASKNGEYTLSVEAQNLQVNYLHLIDNKTGMDVDLLKSPTYTFEANISDYESRFRLVFNANDVNENVNENETFAFISNGQIILNGVADNATVQVIDMLGRVIVCRDAMHGISTTAMTPGVYVLRVINGNNVKTQKIVVE